MLGHDLLCTCKRVVLGYLSVTHILMSGVLDYMHLQLPVCPHLPAVPATIVGYDACEQKEVPVLMELV